MSDLVETGNRLRKAECYMFESFCSRLIFLKAVVPKTVVDLVCVLPLVTKHPREWIKWNYLPFKWCIILVTEWLLITESILDHSLSINYPLCFTLRKVNYDALLYVKKKPDQWRSPGSSPEPMPKQQSSFSKHQFRRLWEGQNLDVFVPRTWPHLYADYKGI